MTPTTFHRTSDLPQRPRMTSPPRVRIEVLSERKPTVAESGRTRTSGAAQRRRARRQCRRSALGGPRGARRATPALADQHGSHLTLRPCPGPSKPVEFGHVHLRGARRLEERGGGRAPQQPYSSSADQPGRDERLDATVVQYRHPEPGMAHRPREGAGQLQRRQDEQHRGQDARPVPALTVRPRHPEPQGDYDQAEGYRYRDDERFLGREAAAQELPADGDLDVDDDKGHPDDQPDGADGGARVHEPDG